MDAVYLLFFPLAILLVLMAYVFSQNPKARANRLFALYMLFLAIGVYAILVMTTTSSRTLAIAMATGLLISVFCLNPAFLTAVILQLYFRRHVTRWYGLPLIMGIGVLLGVAVTTDIALDTRFISIMPPEMGQGYVTEAQYMNGPLVAVIWVWLFAGVLASLVLLGTKWLRQPEGERAPITWLILALLVSGAITPQLPPHPLTTSLNPLLFSVAFAFVVTRYRLFEPAQVSVGAVVRGSTEGMIVCDQTGRVEQINPVAQRLTQVSVQEALGRPFPEAFASLLQSIQHGAEGQVTSTWFRKPFDLQLRLPKPDLHVLDMTGIPIRDPRGQLAGWLLTIRDVTERERAREALEAQARLAETIRELSTPIIPITQDVLILPLIGAIDSERAQSIKRDMLKSIRKHRARVILIDITGVAIVDTMVTNHLLQAVQATQLLGCQGVLVGIRAEVARTLVELGTDLSGLLTKGSLQDGLEYAISQGHGRSQWLFSNT